VTHGVFGVFECPAAVRPVCATQPEELPPSDFVPSLVARGSLSEFRFGNCETDLQLSVVEQTRLTWLTKIQIKDPLFRLLELEIFAFLSNSI
jgi:hypothetical protein